MRGKGRWEWLGEEGMMDQMRKRDKDWEGRGEQKRRRRKGEIEE